MNSALRPRHRLGCVRNFPFVIGAALALASPPCTATSRVGSAVITQIDGIPCFGIPNNAETRNGAPFSAVIVTKNNAPGATTRPEEVWFSYMKPRGKTIILKPGTCIRYGAMPAPSQQERLIPLQPYTVYSVTLDAVPEGTNLRGYDAEFCLIPDAAKKFRVQVVPWDEKASKWRYELCAPGAK